MRDYAATANRFLCEEPISVLAEAEQELLAIKAALYARALTLFEGALLLIENDRQFDFRIHSRGVIEATIYLIALDRDPSLVQKMKDDDYKSRHSRAALHLDAQSFDLSPEVQKALEDFVAHGNQGAKALQVSTLVEGTDFERLYRTYRDISGDAAHVSISSLSRHYTPNPADGSAKMLLHPELDNVELLLTLTELGISMNIATLALMKVREQTASWQDFQDLLRRYRELVPTQGSESLQGGAD